jgi:hypothetical protein
MRWRGAEERPVGNLPSSDEPQAPARGRHAGAPDRRAEGPPAGPEPAHA